MEEPQEKVPWLHRLLDVQRELSLVEDAKQRTQVFAEANLFSVAAVLFFFGVSIPFEVWFDRPLRNGIQAILPGPRMMALLFASFVVGALKVGFYYVGFWLGRRDVQRSLRKALRKRGYAICIGCGYDLRATTEPRCPECGAAFTVGPATNSAATTDKPVQRENAID